MIKTFKLFESSIVDRKVELLNDLSMELQDIGLEVKIWKQGKFIILSIRDNNDVISNFDIELHNTTEIKEFENRLTSYGMRYRGMSAGGDLIQYRFDKWGSMTKSPMIYN